MKKFGTFLLDREIISEEQLVAALEAQRREQIPIGRLALAKGYLSPGQIQRILELRVEAEESQFFGEVASELGYLTQEQVEELLSDQRHTRLPIGEFLVATRSIHKWNLASYLRDYREHCLSLA